MGVSSTTNRLTYAGDGSSTVFGFSYYFFTQSDLQVYLYDTVAGGATLQSLNTHYTVSGSASASGVYPLGANVVFNSSPSSTQKVVIFRNPTEVQNFALAQNGLIPSTALVQQLDYLTLLVQRLEDQVSRAVILPDGVAATFSTQLPSVVAFSPGNVIAINGSSTGLAFISAGSSALTFPISIAQGGTGQIAQSSAFNALSPVTLLGDMIVGGGANSNQRLAGNATATKKYLIQTGSGGFSALPLWGSVALPDVPLVALGDTIYGAAGGIATVLSGNVTATPKFLMQTGSGAVSAAPVWTALIAPTVQTITTRGDGTYTPSVGTKAFKVTVVGGGGGGGGAQASVANISSAAGGGGCGGAAVKIIQVGSTATGTYTVGTGGLGGAALAGTGITGSSSVFTWGSTTITCNPGTGGVGSAGTGSSAIFSAGTGGTASQGDLNMTGSKGSPGFVITPNPLSTSFVAGGNGGANFYATTGTGAQNIEANGGPGAFGGGGGGAAQRQNGSSFVGGAGGNGFIYIEEYYQ